MLNIEKTKTIDINEYVYKNSRSKLLNVKFF